MINTIKLFRIPNLKALGLKSRGNSIQELTVHERSRPSGLDRIENDNSCMQFQPIKRPHLAT